MTIRYMPDDAQPEPQRADLRKLWLNVLEGDQRAFEAVYHACSGAVFGLCLRMTANRATAEDCLQATFIAAWEKRSSFRGDSRLTTWLHRIAVNAVLGRGRTEGRLREVVAEYAAEYAEVTATEELFGTASDLDLERAIANLPERSRQVFVLHAIHGYKHEEVAEMMGIASGTSKAHYHRSRELLQATLSDGSQGVLN